MFRTGAHDGFHDAIGDTVALSITPEYLATIGLLDQVPESNHELDLLMQQALAKVAFLPFGLLVDQWRWRVFNGDITADHYNTAWWQLRQQYQGLKAPTPRSEAHFDPGAKYHIAANTPFTRYFLAQILQFQFHRELCRTAGFTGPLHRCSIHNSAHAGEQLRQMMMMGASKPWPDALAVVANSRTMDATAMLDYFAPLHIWLDRQNQNRDCGW